MGTVRGIGYFGPFSNGRQLCASCWVDMFKLDSYLTNLWFGYLGLFDFTGPGWTVPLVFVPLLMIDTISPETIKITVEGRGQRRLKDKKERFLLD